MNEDELERRLRDAVSAETESVRVDEVASLASIRRRAAVARRRRLVGATALGAAAALVIGVAIGAAAGSNDHDTHVATGGPRTTIGADCASTTTTVPPTTYATTPATAASDRTVVGEVVEHNGGSEIGAGDGCGNDPTTTTATAPSTPTTELPTTTVPPAATTTTATSPPVSSPDDWVTFPFDGSGEAGASPEQVATAFLRAIGVDHPALGDFVSDGWTEGTIELHGVAGDGSALPGVVRSKLFMKRVNWHWVVVSAITDSIDTRDVTFTGHTMHVSGWGQGFEAVLHVQLI
ncbi:MAG: hypothetical protein JO291_04575, partial [Acidimicrobiia bacterium]|nr:hypothetical protein [Acidimicrobiia bacterium]